MSKFKKYAKELEKCFIEARENYKKIYDEYIYAKNKFDIGKDIKFNETQIEFQARRLQENSNLKKAELKLKECKIWEEYKENAEMLTRKLDEEIKTVNAAKPNNLDRDAFEIIKANVLTAEELEQYVTMYLDNAVMRRIITQSMHERLKTEQKDSERAILYRAIEKAENGLSAEQENFRSIIECSYVLSGAFTPSIYQRGIYDKAKNDPEYMIYMQNKWEENMEKTIENF